MRIVSLLLVFLASTAIAQISEPLIFNEKAHDFGSVQESGGNVATEFSFLNNSGRPIKILDVRPSCGCTTPDWTRDAILPGKSGVIKASFDPRGKIGYFNKTISCIGFVFAQALEFLNLKSQRREIPEAVASFYDKDKYLKSLDYNRDHTRFDFVSSGFSFILSIAMLALGGFGWLDGMLRSYVENPIVLSLVFFGVIGLASDWLTLPFQWYGTFVLEEKYEFNKTTVKTFILDKLKGYALGAILGGGLLTLFIFIIDTLGANFWIWFGLIAALVILLINMFYTSLLLPLFNKLTPLPDGELKDAIRAFAQKVSFPLDHIYVIDGSKRSAKANAFFSGIGKKKKIVLYDTLIEKHTMDELVAVLAHEVGHYKKKHIVWGYLLSVVQVFFMLWVLSLMIFHENLSVALGGTQQALHLSLIAFGILFSPISGITGLFMSMLSRKNEFEADAYARLHFDGAALGNALKKLSVDTLSNLFPHPLYVFFHYSHPPLLQRLSALQEPKA